jgi:hypothetical protein
MRIARRSILWSALGAAAAPPSDRVRVVLMGVRGRGRSLTQAFAAQPDVDIASVCDVDSTVVEPALQWIEKSGRPRPPVVSDIRRCLDDRSIDAIVMGTPLHWHAPGTILACAAGKDVYVEKPVSHNIREGRLMVEAPGVINGLCRAGRNCPASPSRSAFSSMWSRADWAAF